MKLQHIALALVAAPFFAGCPGETETEFDMLTTYMAENDMDLPAMTADWIIGAQDAFDAPISDFYIMDIRTGDKYDDSNSTSDFEEGHIDGAVNVPLADVVAHATENNITDTILVVCYSGQTAGHAVMALRLAGFDAKVLKFGMSGWNTDFDVWTANTGDAVNDHAGSWITDATIADPPVNTEFPLLETAMELPEDILDAQVDGRVLDGFNSMKIADVLASPSDYYIVNYWSADDAALYGHIDGAMLIPPGELTLDTLDQLDPTKEIIIYCWTGQTASMVAAWLNVLGYDAYSLLFSSNGMIYSTLDGHKYNASNVPELAYVGTMAPT